MTDFNIKNFPVRWSFLFNNRRGAISQTQQEILSAAGSGPKEDSTFLSALKRIDANIEHLRTDAVLDRVGEIKVSFSFPPAIQLPTKSWTKQYASPTRWRRWVRRIFLRPKTEFAYQIDTIGHWGELIFKVHHIDEFDSGFNDFKLALRTLGLMVRTQGQLITARELIQNRQNGGAYREIGSAQRDLEEFIRSVFA